MRAHVAADSRYRRRNKTIPARFERYLPSGDQPRGSVAPDRRTEISPGSRLLPRKRNEENPPVHIKHPPLSCPFSLQYRLRAAAFGADDWLETRQKLGRIRGVILRSFLDSSRLPSRCSYLSPCRHPFPPPCCLLFSDFFTLSVFLRRTRETFFSQSSRFVTGLEPLKDCNTKV